MRPQLPAAVAVVSIVGIAACGSSTPASPTASTSPVTETFSSMLAAGGTSAHTFMLTERGTITVTLTSVDPAIQVGVGIGIAGGAPSCSLTKSALVAPGTTVQIAETAGPGGYCAEIYDPGTVVEQVNFSMTIQHPD
jgi:hypothetical protein